MSDMPAGLALAGACKRADLATVLFTASLVSGCLVTDQVKYDPPIIPSVVTRDAPFQFEPFREQRDEACTMIGNFDGHMLFTVEVSDLNLEEDLEVRTLVNGKYVAPEGEVLANKQEKREPFTFCIPRDDLARACNRIDVLVSTGFQNPTSISLPKLDGDIASTHWYVIGSATNNPNASYLDCPGAPDAGVR